MAVPDVVKAVMASCGASLPDALIENAVAIAEAELNLYCEPVPDEAKYAYAVITLLPPNVLANCGGLWQIVFQYCPNFTNNLIF